MTQPIRQEGISRLLIRGPNWLGDAVMSEPAITGIRQRFPGATITLLAKPAIAELFQGHPAIDEIFRYEHVRQHAGLVGKWTLSQSLRRQRFDLAILLQNAFEAALLAWLANIPLRYGYATDGRRFLLTHAIPVPRSSPALHQVHYYVNLLKELGVTGNSTGAPSPRLVLSPKEQEAGWAQLRALGVMEGDVLIGVNPGSTYGSAKRWFPERFAQAAQQALQQASRTFGRPAKVVIIGAPGEESLGKHIAHQMQDQPIQLSGKTSIRELMAVLQRCALLITNDTGPMHVAAALGVPIVAVFGPTDSATTSPMGSPATLIRQPVDCAPCLLRECPIDHRCMERVDVKDVAKASAEHLGAFARRQPNDDTNVVEGTRSELPLQGVTVFLDRDGTINKDVGYLGDPKDLELLSGAVEAVARLKLAGARVILITNQSGIGRGYYSHEDLKDIHQSLEQQLWAAGGSFDAIYYCPHHPEESCDCRKPKRGMIDQALRDHSLDLAQSYFVGDHHKDMVLGKNIGARTVLVQTGPTSMEAERQLQAEGLAPDFLAPNLSEGVEWIIQRQHKH